MPVSLQKADFIHLKRSKAEDINANSTENAEDVVEDGEIEDGLTVVQSEQDTRVTRPFMSRRPSVVDSEASSRPCSPPPAHAKDALLPAPPTVVQTQTLPHSSTPDMDTQEETSSSRSESPPPGLTASASLLIMSAENLDHAKDIVLDLLGWGVSPEYLVDCGVSPQSLYQIFADLRLQLPENLSTGNVV
ncbi:hypothetical protein BDQ17DRAFT_1344755 [Cyathus striatus]|nr:hypothetical protein BDQ17DRAFT_1344755 [Cyathus striatus]